MAARKDGRQGHKAEKIWRDAVMRAVKRVQKGDTTKPLERLADQLVQEGLAGNVVALKEIGDRLDGRPAQTVAGDPDQPMELVVRVVKQD